VNTIGPTGQADLQTVIAGRVNATYTAS
jgi:hypothetical protein